jgi:pullulanase/glycogen debranching enzyme
MNENKPTHNHMKVWPGKPYPLGATWDGAGVNFSIFSENATGVELCLYDWPEGKREIARIPMPEHTDQIWHAYLPEARPGLLYGYRVHGPYAPEEGHRFNPAKLLLDPYAKAMTGTIQWSDALFGYAMGHPDADLSKDERDSAPGMPKCVVVDPAFSWHTPIIRCLGLRLSGEAIEEVDERGNRIVDDTLLILLNADPDPTPFVLPAFQPNVRWELVLDTREATGKRPHRLLMKGGEKSYMMEGRSLALFRLRPVEEVREE